MPLCRDFINLQQASVFVSIAFQSGVELGCNKEAKGKALSELDHHLAVFRLLSLKQVGARNQYGLLRLEEWLDLD